MPILSGLGVTEVAKEKTLVSFTFEVNLGIGNFSNKLLTLFLNNVTESSEVSLCLI